MRVVVLALVLGATTFATTASADTTIVTYTATQTIPVPPASNYAGTGGGDGWAVALSPTSVYNVFHHSSILQLACHTQADAKPCWDPQHNGVGVALTISDAKNGFNFAVSGQPGLSLDQATGHLYLFATRWSSGQGNGPTGGVVCIDTTVASPTTDPFCGFVPLTGPGESVGQQTTSGISDLVQVGTRIFAFNYFSGAGVTGAQNKLLCFDLATAAACPGQPFGVDVAIGNGTVSASNFPAPSIAAVAAKVVVPINANGTNTLGCFDTATLATCAGGWPITQNVRYSPSSSGAPFPLLSASGAPTGFCLPTGADPCYSLAGASVDTPAGMTAAIQSTSGWNGPAVVIGPRVYVPNGFANQVACYDYNQSSGCANFPRAFSNPSLSLLYTVNEDPQRPDCLWVNADSGTQIQNFDAFTGGACGQGPIRVLASTSVAPSPLCTPGSYTSLQVTSPARSAYTSGTVSFRDPSNNAIPGAADVPLDATGTASLTGLSLNTSGGLPQFLITLDTGNQGRPQSVVVQLTWTGVFDASCLTKPGTEVVNPPTPTPPSGGGPSVPAKADVQVNVTGPTYVREGAKATFTVTVKNAGPDTATGVLLRAPTVPGATFVSATTTVGNGCSGAVCYIGTLAPGASAVVTLVYTANQTGSLVVKPTVESDNDPDRSNNNGAASPPVIAVGAPPPPPAPPSQPGTFNAIGTGTVLLNGKQIQSDQLLTVTSGDDIDVTDGSITIVTADGSVGTFSSSQPTARRSTSSTARATANLHAEFVITQPAGGGPALLTLAGGSFAGCGNPRSLTATNSTPVRQLWGSARGNFSTKGRFAAATVRGTIWLTQDRCDGTLTQVVDGVVEVADSTLGKTVSVTAGTSYLAPVTGTFKPPTVRRGQGQTAAQVRQNGLLWGGKAFKTKAALTLWLRGVGESWKGFERAHPVQAKALAARG